MKYNLNTMKTFKYIDKVGVETEGAFLRKPDPNNKFLSTIKDEWMQISPEERKIIDAQNLQVGERNSEPFSSLTPLRAWLKEFYPVVYNPSNGFHVHVSFKNDSIRKDIIASRAFHKDFIEAAKKFALNPRLKLSKSAIDRAVGNCQGHHAYSSSSSRSGVTPFADYGTSEFRLFSGDMNAKQADRVLTWLVTYIEDYLETHNQRERCKNIGVVYTSYSGQAI